MFGHKYEYMILFFYDFYKLFEFYTFLLIMYSFYLGIKYRNNNKL